MEQSILSASGRLWLITAVISFGCGFPYAMNLVIPNTAHQVMKAFINETLPSSWNLEVAWSAYMSLGSLGGLAAAFLSAALADWQGRTRTSLLGIALAMPGYLAQVLAEPFRFWPLLYLGRFMSTLGTLLCSVTVTIFVSEIGKPSRRGARVSSLFFGRDLGGLVGMVVGSEFALGTSQLWKFAFLVPLVVSALTFLFLCRLPDSPQYLMSKGHQEDAEAALNYYAGHTDSLPLIRQDCQSAENTKHGGLRSLVSLFAHKRNFSPLILTILLSAAVIFGSLQMYSYSTGLLVQLGLSNSAAQLWSIGFAIWKFPCLFSSLALIDRYGRRPLVLSAVLVMAVSWSVLLIVQLSSGSNQHWLAYVAAGVILLVETSQNVALRASVFTLVVEIFPFHYRSAGKTLSVLVGSFCSYVVSFSFWPLLTKIDGWTYLLGIIPLALCLSSSAGDERPRTWPNF